MPFEQPKQFDEGSLIFDFNEGLNDLRIGAVSLIVNYCIIVLYSALDFFEVTRAFTNNVIISYIFSFPILIVSVFGYFRMSTAINQLIIILKPTNNTRLQLIKKLFYSYFAVLILDYILSMIFFIFTSISQIVANYIYLVLFVLAFILYAVIFLSFSLLFKELGSVPGFNSKMLFEPFILTIATITGILGRIMFVIFSTNGFWFYFNSIAYLVYALIVVGIYIELLVTINRIDIEQVIHSLYS